MKTKGEHVNAALRVLRISGITVAPSGDELSDCLESLEDMMNYLSETIDTNWNKESIPDGGTPSGVDDAHNEVVSWNLAIRLVDMYGKQETPRMTKLASAGLQQWRRSTVKVQTTSQPATMPVGSGNHIWGYDYDNFYSGQKQPIDSKTEYANKGDTDTTKVYFPYNVASVNVTTTSGVTVNSSAIDGGEVSLNLSFAKSGYMIVKVVATEDEATNPKVTTSQVTYVVGEVNV